MDLLAEYPDAISAFLFGAGVALIIVPSWLRWGIAVLMIALGLVGFYPELIPA